MLKEIYEGVSLDEIKNFADDQFFDDGNYNGRTIKLNEKLSLVKGVEIVDPWMDETGRYDLDDEEAVATYGIKALEDFCERVAKYIK